MAVAPALDLPWHSPPRVLATMVMGRSALANILQFKLVPFLVGVVVLVVLTVALGAVFGALVRARPRARIFLAGLLFALTGWALLQYFLLPLLFPLVTDKGFTPRWYAVTFGVYGLVLGALVAALRPPEPAVAAATPGRRPVDHGRADRRLRGSDGTARRKRTSGPSACVSSGDDKAKSRPSCCADGAGRSVRRSR